MSLDVMLFRQINGWAGRIPVLDGFMRLLMNDYFVPTVMSFILLALWFSGADRAVRRTNQQTVVMAVLSLLLANGVVKLCNLVYFRPRPFDSLTDVHLLFYKPWDPSWPSNAGAVGFAFATAVWLSHRRLGALMLVLAALFAFARVFGGVHYPTDVLAGAGIGIGAAWVVRRLSGFSHLAGRLIALAQRLYLA